MEEKPARLYDLKELQLISPDDEEFITEMIRLFITQNETAMQEIKVLMDLGDYAEVKSVLHRIKSSAAVMHVDRVPALIRQAELSDPNGPDEAAFRELVRQIDVILGLVNEQLRLH